MEYIGTFITIGVLLIGWLVSLTGWVVKTNMRLTINESNHKECRNFRVVEEGRVSTQLKDMNDILTTVKADVGWLKKESESRK